MSTKLLGLNLPRIWSVPHPFHWNYAKGAKIVDFLTFQLLVLFTNQSCANMQSFHLKTVKPLRIKFSGPFAHDI